MSEFTKDLDELAHNNKKCNLTRYLKKNYKENVHYIVKKGGLTNTNKRLGGAGLNKITYMLTESAFELFKNTYNLRNKYIVNLSDTVKQVNIGMCLENQTIGFIENVYSNMLNVKRQYKIGKYRADLYFIDYKLVIECDENGHADRDYEQERKREEYILSLGNKIIRYNPNESSFDLSNVLREITAVLFSSKL
jgi:very-short-patch-repair endonuclease